MAGYVDDGRLPGYACLVSRRGAEALFLTCGAMDVERDKPIRRDTIFRLYSMTKPITSVALMMLYEKGHFQLDDPVAKFIPAWQETPYEGIGFGLGFSVVIDPAAANVLDSVGDYAWGGAASTYFWNDPAEDLTVLFMTQLIPPSSYPIRRQLKALVYQALVD